MIQAALPAAMVVASFALLVGFAPPAKAALALAAMAGLAIIVWGVGFAPLAADGAILLCWGAVVALGVAHYRPTSVIDHVLAIGLVAGAIVGIALATMPRGPAAMLSLLPAVIAVPSALAVRHGLAVAPRVVASWLLAVALLAALIPYAVTHPGYVPDHRG